MSFKVGDVVRIQKKFQQYFYPSEYVTTTTYIVLDIIGDFLKIRHVDILTNEHTFILMGSMYFELVPPTSYFTLDESSD